MERYLFYLFNINTDVFNLKKKLCLSPKPVRNCVTNFAINTPKNFVVNFS